MGGPILEVGERQAKHRAGDDDFTADMELHAEAGVDSTHLEKAAAEGAASQLCLAPVREELTTAEPHQPTRRVEHDQLIKAVVSEDRQRLEQRHFIDLTPVAPLGVGPVVEHGGSRHSGDR